MPRFGPLPKPSAPRTHSPHTSNPDLVVDTSNPATLSQLSSTIGNAAMRRLIQRQSYLDSVDDEPGTISGGADYGGMLPSGNDGVAGIPEQGEEPGSSLPSTEDNSKASWPSMPEMPEIPDEPGDLGPIVDRWAPTNPTLYPKSGCTPDFCAPFSTNSEAINFRRLATVPLLAAIAAQTGSATVANLYRQHLWGGVSSPVDLSSSKGEFEQASATTNAVLMLAENLRAKYENTPPAFPQGIDTIEVDLAQELPQEIADIDDPASSRRMDFSTPGETPSIVAGGIGKDQTAHAIGAQPSGQDDSRIASGKATVIKNSDGSLLIKVHAHFEILDTVDMCPGNCGGTDEQVLTRPLSWLEASGISGDVPVKVEYDGPEQAATTKPKAPGGGSRNPFGG